MSQGELQHSTLQITGSSLVTPCVHSSDLAWQCRLFPQVHKWRMGTHLLSSYTYGEENLWGCVARSFTAPDCLPVTEQRMTRHWHTSLNSKIVYQKWSPISVLWRCCLGSRKGIRPVKMGGLLRWALVSPDGVAPSRIVCVSASVNLPLHHKVQKFSSGTGSPGRTQKKGRKTVVVCGAYLSNLCRK